VTNSCGGPTKVALASLRRHGCNLILSRLQKCDEQPNVRGGCQTRIRLRLRLQCLGLGANLKGPEWMRVSFLPRRRDSTVFYSLVQESGSVPVLHEKIKTFLVSQGMVKRILVLGSAHRPQRSPPLHRATDTGLVSFPTCGMPSTLTSPPQITIVQSLLFVSPFLMCAHSPTSDPLVV